MPGVVPKNREITKALMFDVDSKQWNQALDFLSNLKFDQNYKEVLSIPLMQQRSMEKYVMASF